MINNHGNRAIPGIFWRWVRDGNFDMQDYQADTADVSKGALGSDPEVRGCHSGDVGGCFVFSNEVYLWAR